MVEEERGPAENGLPATEPQPRHDFSVVQGFQVVGAEDHGAVGDHAWRDALRLELEARAARLHQAVDAAIVLSNDGLVRWLGDPVAKLSLGPNVLSPGVVILADDSLPDASRETIRTRIELWISATTRRILAPLFALEGIQEGSEIVRDLAHEVVRSLGVLEREPIKARIKALAQDDRAELRKQGVRFGAYYIFVPSLLKPAARNLALQLWSVQAPGDDTELLRTLGSVASSGRTSLPLDNGISKDGYRVAGYRPCGERIVRVDVAERLAGMIRAAIAGETTESANGRPGHRAAKGFVVSGEMTSLTGCSGELFASILRSMGFRPVEMKRSDFFGSRSANEVASQSEPPKPAEDQEPIADNQASPPAAREDETTADAVLAGPPTEPPPDAVLEGADDAVAGEVDSVPEDGDAVPEDGEAVAEPADTFAEIGDLAPVETATSRAADPPDGDRGEDASAQAVAAPTSGSSSEPAKNADVIVVWRPERSRIAHNRGQSDSRQSGSGTRSRAETDGPAPGRKWARKAAPRPPSQPNRSDHPRPDEKRRHRTSDYDMPPFESNAGAAA